MKELAAIPAGSVLGINYTCMHDSSIAVVGPDGQPEFACALERVTRTKQDGRWPAELLQHVPWDRIDAIAVGSLDMPAATALGKKYSRSDWPGRRKPDVSNRVPFPYPSQWQEKVTSLPGKMLRYDHHHCHAASAYYLTRYQRALVITCDAGAHQCPWNFAVYQAEGDRVELVAGAHFLEYMAPAHLYTLVTALLGMRPNRHEGKVTGLSARVQIADSVLARFEEIAWSLAEDLGKLVTWDVSVDLDHAPTCIVNEAVRVRWRQLLSEFSDQQLAACAQRTLEDQVLKLVDHAREISDDSNENVCLAGGVFANVLLNQKVIQKFKRGFVAPAMTDDGVALGAAYLGHAEVRPGASPRQGRNHMYLGPALKGVVAALEERGLVSERPAELAKKVALLLSEGSTVAVARGRMEFGPRALGHRSILSQATDPSINGWLNARLQRTEYMPFAPMALASQAGELFEGVERFEDALRFMTVTVDCCAAMVQESPAAVHVDNTARPQTIATDDDTFCAEVLTEYHALTGLRSLVNTSFNVHEQPIICSVEDAILSFAQTRLDYLCLDDRLLSWASNRDALEKIAQDCLTWGKTRHVESERS